MYVYKDILGKLKKAGYSSYRIRNEGLFSEGTIQNIRDGKPITVKTLDAICQILHCTIDEVVEIKFEKEKL